MLSFVLFQSVWLGLQEALMNGSKIGDPLPSIIFHELV